MSDLDALIASEEQVRALLEGSHIYGDALAFQYWYARRYPIVSAIDKSGSILDIGCANGFLLYCLQAWSEHELEPYGIDPDAERLNACSELFPDLEAHFAPLSVIELGKLPEFGLPATYDFVYWNVWDDFEFGAPQFQGYLEKVFAAVKVGGRLILGFYDNDKARSEAKIAWLLEHFLPLRGRKDNLPFPEIFVWWDKATSEL